MKDYKYLEADDLFDMGSEWLDRGEYEKAEGLLKKAIDLNPNFTYSYITLADAYARRRRFADAVGVLKVAASHDTEFDRLYFLMAKYSFKNGDMIAAKKFIAKAADMNPSKLNLRARDVIERHARV